MLSVDLLDELIETRGEGGGDCVAIEVGVDLSRVATDQIDEHEPRGEGEFGEVGLR